MSLPDLQHADAALLTRYLLAHEDIHTLLAQPNPPALIPLLAFLARPDITPWLDHYRAIMAHARQAAAMNALTEVLRETTDPNHRRLAATTLLQQRTPRLLRQVAQEARQPAATRPRQHAPPAPRHAAPASSKTPSFHQADCGHLDTDTNASRPANQSLAPVASYATPSAAAPALPPTDARSAFPGTWPHADDLTASVSNAVDADRLARETLEHARRQDVDDTFDIDIDLDDDAIESDDPLLAAALTGDPDAIHRFYIERTGQPPDPTLAAALTRALRPISDTAGPQTG